MTDVVAGHCYLVTALVSCPVSTGMVLDYFQDPQVLPGRNVGHRLTAADQSLLSSAPGMAYVTGSYP